MGTIKFEAVHQLTLDEARARIEALLSYWARKYGMRAEWQGDRAKVTGKAMGISIDASLTVAEGKVAGEAGDPGLLVRGQAQKYLTRKFNEYLDPQKSIEDLGRSA